MENIKIKVVENIFQKNGTYRGPLNKNGQMNGVGEIIFPNNDRFIGAFSKDKILTGKYMFENGSYYHISKKYDKDIEKETKYFKFGYKGMNHKNYLGFDCKFKGMLYKRFSEGHYFGELYNDAPCGCGKMIWDYGNTYIGGFKDYYIHGVGVMCYEDGTKEWLISDEGLISHRQKVEEKLKADEVAKNVSKKVKKFFLVVGDGLGIFLKKALNEIVDFLAMCAESSSDDSNDNDYYVTENERVQEMVDKIEHAIEHGNYDEAISELNYLENSSIGSGYKFGYDGKTYDVDELRRELEEEQEAQEEEYDSSDDEDDDEYEY